MAVQKCDEEKDIKFVIENLSVGQADCFLITLENSLKDTCTILVDGNCEKDNVRRRSGLIERISELEKLDYIVVTHCDNDHLGGILELFDQCDGRPGTRDLSSQLADTAIIYNRVTTGVISYKQAERFEQLIRERKIINTCSRSYDNKNAMLKLLPLRKRGILKFNEQYKDNAFLTFLNPDRDGVNQVYNDYRRWRGDKKRKEYAALINRQSIAFMLEFAKKRVLFLGDANWRDIEKKLDAVPELKRCDLIKIPHHGAAQNNTGIVDWAQTHTCKRFIVTGKKIWDEKHPDKDLIESFYKTSGVPLTFYTDVILTIDSETGPLPGYGVSTIDVINDG